MPVKLQISGRKALQTLIGIGVGLALVPAQNARGGGAQTSDAVYQSAYFLGRGNTGVAVADNEDAIFYNPAGIAAGKGIYKQTVFLSPLLEVSQSTRDLAMTAASQNKNYVEEVQKHIGKPDHFGAQNFTGLMFRRAAFGVISSSHADFLAYKDPNAGALEAVKASADATTGTTFTLAQNFWGDHLLIGATGKYLMRGRGEASANATEAQTVQDKFKDKSNFIGTGQGSGADLGLMLHGGGRANPALGVCVTDVGDTHISSSSKTDLNLGLKQSVNVGVSVEPGTKFSKIRLLADYRDALAKTEKDPYKRLHFGGELAVRDTVGVTSGITDGYPTAGMYADLHFLRLDLGAYTKEMSDHVGSRPDTRFYFRLRAGF